MEWAALDFETANSDRSSACALGVAIVREGRILETKSWLIRPPILYFDPYNVMIHGITEDAVKDKPTFVQFWPELCSYLEGHPIAAHNASFDISVLRHTLDEYGIDYPELDYYCTRVIAKVMWPALPSHALRFLADHLGICFEHHVAEDDAKACATIVLQSCHQIGVGGLGELAERLEIQAGSLFPGGYSPCSIPYSIRRSDPRGPLVQMTDFDPNHPFFGKTIVFTGSLQMPRSDARRLVETQGGHCEDSVTKRTNFLIVGTFDFAKFTHGDKSTKLLKAERLKATGADIEILSEDEWWRMLSSKECHGGQ